MKKIHEERWQFKALSVMDGVIVNPLKANRMILLLHGHHERGRRMYRKLAPYLPQDACVLAPNAPFPISRFKDNKMSLGFTWYFYDPFEGQYYLNQDLAVSWLKELMALKNPEQLPLTIIGFSQGGYLAPLVGEALRETELVIGIGCEFRTTIIKQKPPFRLEAVHGLADEVIPVEGQKRELASLKAAGIDSGFHLIENAKHEINNEVGAVIRELLDGKRSL